MRGADDGAVLGTIDLRFAEPDTGSPPVDADLSGGETAADARAGGIETVGRNESEYECLRRPDWIACLLAVLAVWAVGGRAVAPLAYKADLPSSAIGMVSIQIKAWAAGRIPADEAIAIILHP